MSVGKSWCFTLNNYTADDEDNLQQLDCRFILYGHEIAPTTGTPHLQGYVVWNASKRLSGCRVQNPRCNWLLCKGDSTSNIKYCSKGTDIYRRGDPPKTKEQSGLDERQRWKDVIMHAKAGTLEEHDPKVYYNTLSTALKLQAQFEKPVAINKIVDCYWGPTETGKTRSAWETLGEDAYVKDPRSKFWYGYHGQECCIIDEFRGGIDIAHMLRWLDRYPTLVEIKGSSCALKVKHIIITSNVPPGDWYPMLDEDSRNALLRRLNITHFDKIKKWDDTTEKK